MTEAMTPFPNRIPSATLLQILPALCPDLPLAVSASVFGENTAELPVLLPHEQIVVAALVRHFAPRRVFEFGTATGRTTWVLAENSPADATVLTLDLPPPERTDYGQACHEGHAATGATWRAAPSASKVVQLFEDSRRLDAAAVAARHGAPEFLLIDGDHSYNGVRIDTEKAIAMAAQDAVFLWHDFYLLDFVAQQPPEQYDVYQYLNDFAAETDLVLRHILGTYFVVGSRRFANDAPGRVLQPRSGVPFGSAIPRLGDSAPGFMDRVAPVGYAAGLVAFQGGDHAAALAAWRPLAESGHRDAAAALATMLINGQGIATDFTQAARWFRAAAEAGHHGAQLNLGLMYYEGQGIEQDTGMARHWAECAMRGLPGGEARDLAIKLCAALAAA
jgi:predicted O-methyltransferase YrrM